MTELLTNRQVMREISSRAHRSDDASQMLARTRRDFLRSAAGLTLGSALCRPCWANAVAPSKRKVVVVTFGGGARDQETFAPEGQENVPHLMRELIPQAAFFTQVVNH